MSAELKSCPFCGCDADISEDCDRQGRAWTVFCVLCDGSTGRQVDAETAIVEWNRRATPAPGAPAEPTEAMVLAMVRRMFSERNYAAPWEDVMRLAYMDAIAAAPGAPGQEAAAVQAVGAWPAELPLRLQVAYSPGDWDTFVYGVSGHLSMDVLTEIEAAIRGEDSEALFDLGPGDYLLSASHFAGQYGPEGRCEWAPCWEFDIEAFRPPAALPAGAGEKP